ncbi:MAG: serine hydrolase [Cyclobacteriaceae bacterium]
MNEKCTYGEGIDVLGYLIEVIAGMPLNEFLRTRIFEPLEMNDTWFYLPREKIGRLVSLQKKEEGNWIKYPVTFYDPDFPVRGAKAYFSGGAGLVGTAEDYAKFLQMYLNKGELNGVRLLSRTTVDFIMTNQVGDLRGEYGPLGLAFALVDQRTHDLGGKGSAGTFEWGGYFNSGYFTDPKEQLIGIIMKQTQGDWDISDPTLKFRQLVYQAIDD